MERGNEVRILVCDDVPKRGQEAKEAIDAAGVNHEVIVVPFKDFERAMNALVDHGRRFLSDGADAGASCSDPLFASAGSDLMVLDNNLAELDVGGARHTAEGLAGLVRAFTDIPYIVSLNKNPQTDFDLRYLVGDYQTTADLALNLPHLKNHGLWTGSRRREGKGFLPWYWPSLNEVPARRRCQEKLVQDLLEKPILDAVAFDRGSVVHLSRHAKGALSPESEDDAALEAVTFLEFFGSSGRSLPIPSERKVITEALRAASEGGPVHEASRQVVARVVAAELDRWFRRDVIAPQSVLVDVPHLLMRMPFLLGDGAGVLQRWNQAVAASEPPFALEEKTFRRFLEVARYRQEVWTGRTCFWWPKLDGDVELNAMFYEDDSPWERAVFCEDQSRFGLAGESGGDGPREFVAEVEGEWSQRHVAFLDDWGYTPKSRFAL